jgi:hypothetical protein
MLWGYGVYDFQSSEVVNLGVLNQWVTMNVVSLAMDSTTITE